MRFTSKQELRVGVDRPLAAFVEVDEGRVAAAAVRDVVVEGVAGEVGLGADEPAERRRRPLEDAVPGPEPRQLARGALPEPLRVAAPVLDPAIDDRRDQGARAHGREYGRRTAA